jgi:hypothetical protein
VAVEALVAVALKMEGTLQARSRRQGEQCRIDTKHRVPAGFSIRLRQQTSSLFLKGLTNLAVE